jgi:hypothetical protein
MREALPDSSPRNSSRSSWPEAGDGERARQRLAYESIAKRDAPLAVMTPLDATYFSSISNKGAMIWRLIDARSDAMRSWP